MQIDYGVGWEYFTWSVMLGVFAMLCYDVFRISRAIAKHPNALVIAEDIVFILFCAMGIFAVAYFKNQGALRIQGFLGFAAGAIICRIIVRSHIVNAVVAVKEGIQFVILKVTGFVVKPFKKLLSHFRKK